MSNRSCQTWFYSSKYELGWIFSQSIDSFERIRIIKHSWSLINNNQCQNSILSRWTEHKILTKIEKNLFLKNCLQTFLSIKMALEDLRLIKLPNLRKQIYHLRINNLTQSIRSQSNVLFLQQNSTLKSTWNFNLIVKQKLNHIICLLFESLTC